MTTRADLFAHLDALAAAGHLPTCWTVPLADRAIWTSDEPADQRAAARLCGACPALTETAA